MEAGSIRSKLDETRIARLSQEDLPCLLANSTLLREDDTHVAGVIRILSLEDQILVQEQHPERGDVLVRRFPSREEAENFVLARLETYERMWDGCGCKVDYFE